MLAQVSHETVKVLPEMLSKLPGFEASSSTVINLENLESLRREDCPGYSLSGIEDPSSCTSTICAESWQPSNSHSSAYDFIEHSDASLGTRIRVINQDTLDAAIELSELPSRSCANPDKAEDPNASRVVILNLASEKRAGGGWRSGANAQEEAICRRSSLYLSLHRKHYPLPSRTAVYSPNVLVMRDSIDAGHNLMTVSPADMPVVATISVAAIRRPNVTRNGSGRIVDFADEADRQLTKDKMRLILNVAARNGHRRLVLGAMGCGAFRNPPEVVAQCWKEVLTEPEFSGGWWEEIVFAVLSRGFEPGKKKGDENNYQIFERVLGGLLA